MSEGAGFVWRRHLREAQENGRKVAISVKGNPDDEYDGKVDDVDDHIVTLVSDSKFNDNELCVLVLLDDISAVVVEKGPND